MYSFLFHFQVGEQKEYLIHFREEAQTRREAKEPFEHLEKRNAFQLMPLLFATFLFIPLTSTHLNEFYKPKIVYS